MIGQLALKEEQFEVYVDLRPTLHFSTSVKKIFKKKRAFLEFLVKSNCSLQFLAKKNRNFLGDLLLETNQVNIVILVFFCDNLTIF